MPVDAQNNVKIQLGLFEGDAPSQTITLWQSIITTDILVHFDPVSGMKTYLIECPLETDGFVFAESLVSQGIEAAEAVHLIEGNRLRKLWDDFEVIGNQVAVISANVV